MDKRTLALNIAEALCALQAFRVYCKGDFDKLDRSFPDYVSFCKEHSRWTYEEVRLKIIDQVLALEEQFAWSFLHCAPFQRANPSI